VAGPQPIGDPAPADGLLAEKAAADSANRTLHAYVHIPFCTVRCGYCDFNTYTASELEGVKQSDYAQVLNREIDFATEVLANSNFVDRELATVFFGGGTPTQLPAADLVSILKKLDDRFGIQNGAEVTTEANPDSVDQTYLEALVNGGFNRLSIGMQSAVPEVLATLERTHDPKRVRTVIAAAKSAGLGTSVDLIYGAPNESLQQWRTSVEEALAMEPDHISAYALIVEPGTKLARQIAKGELPEPDEDLQADKYELADELFSAAGFDWYEVSNWSKPGQSSKHNIAYWQSQDWWGFGPGAHSHMGGTRWWNVKHPSAYSAKVNSLVSPAAGRETLDEHTRLTERILLEVRIADGLSIELAKEINANAANLIAGFIADGMIEPREALQGQIKLTLKGRLLADALVRALVG
jgi:oxygen-independent coproporphyrinogen-3 oxidase